MTSPITSPTMTTAEAALAYIAAGWVVIPNHPREKRPVGDDWPELRISSDAVPVHFLTNSNIGVLLGENGNGKTDVDLDCSESLSLASAFLPVTKCVHGRAGALRSHWWYHADPVPSFLQFQDTDGTRLLELRCGAGQQTIVPPSTHPSGEAYQWDELEDPATVEATALQCAVRRLAAATLLVRHYPGTGSRHGFALALAGFLVRQGWNENDVLHFVNAVATSAGDEEDRDRLKGVQTTLARFDEGANATGGGKLKELLGKEVLDKFTDFLELPKFASQRKEVLPIVDLPLVEDDSISAWPTAALEGDWISDLTHVLTDGTAVPPQYAREEIVLALGALADGRLSYPAHNLCTRRFLAVISEHPAAGKGESWKRVIGQTGQPTLLGKALESQKIASLDGGVIGSGQYLAQVLEETPSAIAFWDELSELLQKAGQQSSTLFSGLKKLYEGNTHWSGSFTNKKHGSSDAHLSVLMHGTRETFMRMFTGTGAVGDGLLSRFNLVHSPGVAGVPEWAARNHDEEDRLSELLIGKVPAQLLVPEIDGPARCRMNEFLTELRRPNHPHFEFAARLDVHTKIDLLHRAVYSSNSEPRITLDLVDRSIAWAEHQLKLRLRLWTADAGDRISAMTQNLLRRLKKGPATQPQLMTSANVYRDGSHEVFNRALGALLRSSQIQTVGETRKHTTVFALVPEENAEPL
jgi:hypothetical protein